MNISTIHSKAVFIATLVAKAWEAVGGGPGGKIGITNAHLDLLVADVVKHIGASLIDRKIGKQVYTLSQEMAANAAQAMNASWEWDDLCPPWPWPPHVPDLFREPEPTPWTRVPSAEQVELGHLLIILSGLTTSKKFNVALKSLAAEIVTKAIITIEKDFSGSDIPPRKLLPEGLATLSP